MLDLLILIFVLALSLPVFAYTVYTVVLLVGSLTYRPLPQSALEPEKLPYVTILIAVYNERSVVEQTIEAIGMLDYPTDKLQLVVADDSTDETVSIIDSSAQNLRERGVEVVVSRRHDRAGFKAGALNKAASRLKGEYLVLLDSDSRLSSSSLRAGAEALRGSDLSFVSFRVGHYNREANLVTRSFALFQDTIDGLQKMGATRFGLPYSLQGGFVMLKADALSAVGYWREGLLAEDADLSCRLFAAGFKGAYLSGTQLLSEDPSRLRAWKRQAARVAHGWAQCLRADFYMILTSKDLGPFRKAGLLLTLLSPLAGLSWILVTLVSAIAFASGIADPKSSVFSNPAYIAAVSLPVVIFYISGVNSLKFRGMVSGRNLALLPELSYLVTGMFTISAISFVSGLLGRRATFFRTPKAGSSGAQDDDPQAGEGRGVRALEASLSVLAILLSLPILFMGQYVLGISLIGFGLVTLKSMELSSLFMARKINQSAEPP